MTVKNCIETAITVKSHNAVLVSQIDWFVWLFNICLCLGSGGMFQKFSVSGLVVAALDT